MELHRMAGRLRSLSFGAASMAVAIVLLQSAGSLSPGSWQLTSGNTTSTTTTSTATDWSEFHQSALLDGVSSDATISATNAGTLGIKWTAATGGSVLSSPIVATVPSLGEQLTFIGNESGYVIAYNSSNGVPQWSDYFPSTIRSTPLYENGFLWVAPTQGQTVYKLDAATGSIVCSAHVGYAGQSIESTPVFGTPIGGVPTIYIGLNDNAQNGPVVSINEANCGVGFSSTPEAVQGTGGVWDELSFVNLATESLVLFGTSDPDSTIYAINASTGAMVWKYASFNPAPHTYDVGAGVVISPPGVNGFADGVAYVEGKTSIMYALNLTTGALIWQYNFALSTGYDGGLSTAALSGTSLVVGTHSGVLSLNAVTGALNWNVPDVYGIDSSPAITGPIGGQVVVVGDFGGLINVLSLATGATQYSYQTAGYIVSSPAESNGVIYEASSDGYLYALALGGGNGAEPTTSIGVPSNGQKVSYQPSGVTISGTATASSGNTVASVRVSVQQAGSAGQWWDAATSSWVAAPYPNLASLLSPGGAQSNWTLQFPAPQVGGAYNIFASTVDANGMTDISAFQSPPSPSRVAFVVNPDPTMPTLVLKQTWLTPGAGINVTGSGFSPNELVTLTLNSQAVASATASGTGTLSARFTVPSSASYGPQNLVATGGTSGLSTSAPVYVTNAWSQQGQGPANQAYEKLDSLFVTHVSIGSAGFLVASWSAMTGAAIPGSPLVYHGRAYAVTVGGLVESIDISTGKVVWSTQLPSSPAVNNTPAITTDGHVVVVTSNGVLYSIKSASGVVAGSINLATAVDASPTVVGNNAYVESTSGLVEEINVDKLGVIWHTTLPSGSSVTAALALGSKSLYVATESDQVFALNSTSGTTKWVISVPNTIATAPMFAFGHVYFGTSNGDVYSLSASTGATNWKFTAPSQISAAPILFGSEVAVGTQGGVDYILSPTSGKSTYSIKAGNPIVGLSSAKGFLVTTMSNGSVLGSKPTDTNPFAWREVFSSSATSSAAVVNGEVFVTGGGGEVYCYTLPGMYPV